MSHFHTVTIPRAENVKSLDPLLPLADLPNSRNFYRYEKKQKITGRVIPQRIDQDNTQHHPDVFYVEFPLDSGNFHEVSISKIAGSIGDRKTTTRFITRTAAETLDLVPAAYDLVKLLQISKA